MGYLRTGAPLFTIPFLATLLITAVLPSASFAGQAVNFPDPALNVAVRTAIGKPTGDVLATDLVGVGFSSLNAEGVSELIGLEYCLDLQELTLINGSIDDLSPLAFLTKLTLLNLNSNQATDLDPVASLPNLETLRLRDNGISVLPPLGGLTNLTTLTLGQNEIADLSPLVDLPALIAAGLADNAVASIPTGSIPATLEELLLPGNDVVDLSGLSDAAALHLLDLSGNQITDISALRINFGLGEEDTLNLSGNPLGVDALCFDIPTLQERGVTVTHQGECDGEGEVEPLIHVADQDGDGDIGLTELLRVVQLFNGEMYSCAPLTEDGYDLGDGDRTCPPHSGDYAPQDWRISLSELLRLVQFFNAGGYYDCIAGEDLFCAGQKDLPPNVVFIVIDTLRGSRIGATRNGIPVTPFLAGVAAQGANFTNAHAPSSWTRPSMFGYFTGMYPNPDLDAEVPGSELYAVPTRFVALGEWFAGYGYDCRGWQTNGNVLAELGFGQGFDTERYVFLNEYPAALVTNAILESQAEWKEPFFSFVQYYDPHGPYAPPVEYQEVFGPQPVIDAADSMNLSVMAFRAYLQKIFGAWFFNIPPAAPVLSENGVAAMRYRYDAEIRYLDDELARLFDSIEEAHPNTIFVVVSEHGEALQERELLIGHGHTLYDEQTHVPLIFKGPGFEPQTIGARVEALGVLPTLANALGVNPLPQWQSTDCFEQAANPGAVFGSTLTFYDIFPISADCVTENGLKYIDHSKFAAPHLYDLRVDPGETTNLAESQPETMSYLSGLLDAHRNEVAQSGK